MDARTDTEIRVEKSELAKAILGQGVLSPKPMGRKFMPHILIVDDHSACRSLIKMILLKQGLDQIDEACDGRVALSKLADASYDLVICDLFMPSLDGFGLLGELRTKNVLKGLPVIIVTCETRRDFISKAIELGISGYVSKPFKPSALISAVCKVLSHRRTAEVAAGCQ